MLIKRILIGLVILGVITTVFVLNLGDKEQVKIYVHTEKARIEPITQSVQAAGKIKATTEVKLASDVTGYIHKLTVKQGDSVGKGELLVQIDPETYRAQVLEKQASEQSARAMVKRHEATQQRLRSEERRVKELYDKDLTSRAKLDNAQAGLAEAEADVDSARADLLRAQASLTEAKKNLQKCTIFSPISGTVVTLNKEVGELVSGGDFREDIIMKIAQLTSMEVEVEVSERDIVLISLNDFVKIEVDAYPGKIIPGAVTEIANAGTTRNPGTESEVTNFMVKVAVEETDLVLRPEMSTTVRIRTDHKEKALTVPIQSVTMRRLSEIKDELISPDNVMPKKENALAMLSVREAPVEVVFIVRDNRAWGKAVKTGLSSDERIEIIKGIDKETQIVSGPYRVLSQDLKHGSWVESQ